MKKIQITLIAAFIHLSLFAQNTESNSLYEEGQKYLIGIEKAYNPTQAKKLFTQSAILGNAKAMNSLAGIYLKCADFNTKIDSAIFWYKASVEKGNTDAYYNLGIIYKEGLFTKQNFSKAASYFQQGSLLNNKDCLYMLSYMQYKGLGVKQNYANSFEGFTTLANGKNASAMYYIALCYRNGYGTLPNMNLAKEWLQKAADLGDIHAKQELIEELPENKSVADTYFQLLEKKLTAQKERFISANENNYEGLYTGYAIYYDWSGKFINEILPIKIDFKKVGNTYEGFWEEDNQINSIKLNQNKNQFIFDRKCSYNKVNHYSGRISEKWYFTKANLDLSFIDDSIQIRGYVNFYSVNRKEPNKPLQIIIKKPLDPVNNYQSVISFSLNPNPASTSTHISFAIEETAKINFVITTVDGKIVYVENDKKLPKGAYTYLLPLSHLISGSYYIQLLVNGQPNNSKILIKL